MGPGNVLTPDVEIPGVPDRRARGVRRVLVVCSGPLQRPRHAAHGHGSAPPMRRSVAVVIADTHISIILAPNTPVWLKIGRPIRVRTTREGRTHAGTGAGAGAGVWVGAVGAGMLGKHVAVAAAGFPISGGFRGAGWGFPKAKVPYMGTTGWCRTHPRWPGTAWGGCRKFSEISGNCRQLPEISDATLERQVFQSWAVWCSSRTVPK